MAQHRDVWTVEVGEELAGLIIYNEETHQEAQTKNPGPKILKLCTFKLKPEFRGEKFGEHLLKQVLWHAQRGTFHRKLFPEISFERQMPLFPTQRRLIGIHDPVRTPGNTIRKVYLCRAQTNRLSPGDLIFFYISRDIAMDGSQSVTTVGVVERVSHSENVEQLLRLTARRSVYSVEEQRAMQQASTNPVKVIDFLLVGHCDPFIELKTLLQCGIFRGHPPQSIVQLNHAQYESLKPLVRLCYEN